MTDRPRLDQRSVAKCALDSCAQACTTECREVINRSWRSLRGELSPTTLLAGNEPMPLSTTEEACGGRRLQTSGRPRVDQLTDDQLDQLYARAEIAEAKARELDRASEVALSAVRLMQEAGARAEQAEAELAGARATIAHMTKAMGWICGHDRQGLDHLEEAQREGRSRESAVTQARRWARRARTAEAALAAFRDRVEAITDEARGGIRQQLGDALADLDGTA